MARIKYVGGHDAVEVAGLLIVRRGDVFDIDDPALAESLLAQSDNYQPAKPPAKAKTEEKP